MSTKTKTRLSQLLFRRSSNNNPSNTSSPPSANSSSSSQSHHKPQVMGCGNNKNTHEEFAKQDSQQHQHHHQLVPSSSFIETTEGNDDHRVLQPQKLVAFSDKHLMRARSSSPSKQRSGGHSSDATNANKPISILKNGQCPPQTKNTGRGRRNALGKATLQRTKSNPIPQQNKTSIDANNNKSNANNAIESTPSSHPVASAASTSSINPLLDLSWNCPTLEKRKELILSYFKNYVLDPEGTKQQNAHLQCNETATTTSDPIYEEINDNTRNQKLEDNANSNSTNNVNASSTKVLPCNTNTSNPNSNTDSLKPKLLPKKVRLNIPLQLEHQLDQQQQNIYDKLRQPTRAASFNIYDTLRKVKSPSSSNDDNNGNVNMTVNKNLKTQKAGEVAESKMSKNGPAVQKQSNTSSATITTTTNNKNSPEGAIISKDGLTLTGGGVGLAHFASEVAQHATSRRANRSNSFTPSSSSSTLNDVKSNHHNCHNNNLLLSPSSNQQSSVDIMDQIYSQLTKRGKKVSSVTSRLLKRHNNNHHFAYNNVNNHHHNDEHKDEEAVEVEVHNDDAESCTAATTTEQHKPTIEKMNVHDTVDDDEVCLSSTEEGLKSNSSSSCSSRSNSSEEVNSKNKRTINVGGNYEDKYECSYECISNSQEDESESQKVEKSCANPELLPVRPLRKGRGITSSSTATLSNNNSNNIHHQPSREKELPEKDLKEALLLSRGSDSPTSYHNHNLTGFINLADVFPPISVIDSTSPQPRAYPLIQFNSNKNTSAASFKDSSPAISDGFIANKSGSNSSKGSFNLHTNSSSIKDIDRSSNKNSNTRNHQRKEISQKKDNGGIRVVVIDDETSVKVKEERDQLKISTETTTHRLLHHHNLLTSGTDDSLSSQQHHQLNLKITRGDNRNDSSIMDLPDQEITSLASSPTEEVIKEQSKSKDQVDSVDHQPLILWEDQKSVVIRQKSPQEDLHLLLGDSSSDTSTTSDLYLSDSVSSSGGSNCGGDEASIITIIRTISPTTPSATTVETSDETSHTQQEQLKMTSTMNDSNEQMRNQFIRQESKHYFDDEDDGGFESFQVVGNEYDEDDGVGVEDGPFSPPSSSGSPDNMIVSRPRTFAQNQQNIPSTELNQKASSVLDLINAEISDLHLRELELKKKNRVADGKEMIMNNNEDDMLGEAERSSQADSDDYTDSAVDIAESYSRTSTSSGNVTPNDGARMDRDVSPHSEKGHQDDEIFESGSSNSKITLTTEEEIVTTTKHAQQQQQQQQGVKVRPIVEEEVKSIALNITKETPIEREIRLVREREEEFRRSRGVSSTSSLVVDSSSDNKTYSQQPALQMNDEEVKVLSVTTPAPAAVTVVSSSSGSSGSKDIQYEMAAARLKREIEEGLKRERELYEEGRLKTLRNDEVKDDSQKAEAGEPSPSSAPQGAAFTPFKTLVKIPKKPSASAAPKSDGVVDPLSVPFGGVPSGAQSSDGNSSGKKGFSFAPAPAAPPAAVATTMSLSVPQEPSMQLQQSSAHQQSQSLPMNKISKPQFTSIEKMILKGSFSFNRSMSEEDKRSLQMEEATRMNKVARMPDPLQIVQRVESIEEIEEGASQTETDNKPRRKYVTAQDKIQIELQEQVKREKELSQLRAKWKSTPDLSKMEEETEGDNSNTKDDAGESSDLTDGVEDEYLPTKPSALRRQRQLSQSTQKIDDVTTSDVLKLNKPTVRRRQSALINQWEEMIKQQQEKNKN